MLNALFSVRSSVFIGFRPQFNVSNAVFSDRSSVVSWLSLHFSIFNSVFLDKSSSVSACPLHMSCLRFLKCSTPASDSIAGVSLDGKYGVRFFAADFSVAVGVEIFEDISSENRVWNRASVPKDLGIRSPLSVLAGNGCGGICENRQSCDG